MKSYYKNMVVASVVTVVLYGSGLLTIFTPLPILYTMIIDGRRRGLLAAFISLCLIASIYAVSTLRGSTPLGSFMSHLPLPGNGLEKIIAPRSLVIAGTGYFIFFIAVAIALGEGTLRKLRLTPLGFLALSTGIAALIVTFLCLISFGGFDLTAVSNLNGYLNDIVTGVIAVNESSLGVGEAQMLKEHSGEIASSLKTILPSLVFIFVLLSVVLNLLIGRRFIKKRHAFSHIHNVARFKLPDVLVWPAIGAGAVFFADNYIFGLSWLSKVSINCLVCLGAFYFLQGLAVVVYFIQCMKASFFRTMSYLLLVIFFQTFAMIILATGVADVWVDFRLRGWKMKHENHENQ